jgi:DNA gyrase subunit A
MRLRRLTGLEKDKILAELEDLLAKIAEYKAILANDELVLKTVKEELLDIKDRFGDERRTYIDMTAIDFIEDESLIPEENIMISLTDKGYIKRCVSSTFKSQNRGGVGVKGMSTNEEDYVKHLINCSTHDHVLFFTNKGKVYRIKGYEIPEYSRQAKGLPIINLLQIEKNETISSIITISKENENNYLVFATKGGIVKRTLLEEYENIRQSGKIAINLREDDELIDVRLSDGKKKVILGSTSGRMVIFDENEIRPMGRTASGVKGMELDGESLIGMDIGTPEDDLLIVTSNGYGKRTYLSEYRMTKRGSKGVKALNSTEKNGTMVAHKIVNDEKDLMIITNSGMLIRLPISTISQLGRVTQGVKLINLKEGQTVSTISVVDKVSESEVEETEEILSESPTSSEE